MQTMGTEENDSILIPFPDLMADEVEVLITFERFFHESCKPFGYSILQKVYLHSTFGS
jgi:hypothetical protein